MAIEEPEKTKVLESCKSLPLKIDEIVSVTTGNNHNNNINNHSNNNNSDKESEEDPEAVNKWLTSIGKTDTLISFLCGSFLGFLMEFLCS